MLSFKNLSIDAAKVAHEAGQLLKQSFGKDHEIVHKGEVDLVTNMDMAAERLIKLRLTELYPEILFFGEEHGGDDWKKGLVWVVDPLDGTTNYANGLPHFCVSIALCQDGNPVAAAIAAPMTNEVFRAAEGSGAFLNDKPIKVSTTSDIAQTLAVTGFPYNRRECMSEVLGYLEAMLMQVQGVRRFGSAALDLCYVAKGLFSIFWELNLKPWDVAAGTLIVKEAGGTISKFDGSPMQLDSAQLLATNSKVHQQAVACLSKESAT